MLIYGHGHPPGENYVCVKRKSSSHPSRLQLYGIVKRHTGEKNERGGREGEELESQSSPVGRQSRLRAPLTVTALPTTGTGVR